MDEVKMVWHRIREANAALDKPTAETMAKATYKAIYDLSKEWGQNPDREVFIKAPGEKRHFDNTDCWVVAWESGPYDWAINASMVIGDVTGKLVEPFYSFDLCFYPSED